MTGDHLALSQSRLELISTRIYELLVCIYDSVSDAFLTYLTGKSRLERLLENTNEWGGRQISMLENCLAKSGVLRPHRTFRADSELESVLTAGGVRSEIEDRVLLKQRLTDAVALLDAYDALCSQVEVLRAERYDSNNELHEKLLLDFWNLVMPNEELKNRISKQWRHVGFQGDDPASDFRGMGILSLHQLIFFARHHPNELQELLVLSHHPQIGFPFAVAGWFILILNTIFLTLFIGITITSLTRHILIVGRLKSHLINRAADEPIGINAFHSAYCKIFMLFAEYWKRANPPSVMAFNSVRVEFERSLARNLGADSADLNLLTAGDLD